MGRLVSSLIATILIAAGGAVWSTHLGWALVLIGIGAVTNGINASALVAAYEYVEWVHEQIRQAAVEFEEAGKESAPYRFAAHRTLAILTGGR